MKSFRCGRCFKPVEVDDEDLDDDDETTICDPCIRDRSAAVPPLDIESTFGPGGPLAAGNPHYEARPGQVKLAKFISGALSTGVHLLAEGPCGIGKSKAYGVPASWLAAHKKKVLIVTASIALQEQLVNKDLPALQRELPWDFTYGIMKGKNNYLCLEALAKADDKGLSGPELDEYDQLVEWSEATGTGDKSELKFRPADGVWSRFTTTSDACPGRKCPSASSCHALTARARAAHAGIIVTNYHLFFMNMVCGGTILPASDVVILDEAHEAADIARDILGFRIAEATFAKFANDADKAKPAETLAAYRIRQEARAFFLKLLRFSESPHYNDLLRWPAPINCDDLVVAVKGYVDACAKSHLAPNALTAVERLVEGLTVANPNCVYSIAVDEDRRTNAKRAKLEARYISPAPVLRSDLWGAYSSVVAVSATMTTDGKFSFARGELGAPDDAQELVVETPFDFARQSMIVIPNAAAAPEPSDPAFVEYAAARTIETIEACGGRTLGLFTSYKMLDAVAERVRRHFGARIRLLTQRDGPAGLLSERFKNDTRSVLLGTSSFWTGIDVPGEALTGLVIDRLPFGSPSDPVSIRINERNPRAFAEHTVPRAILTMRQGVGRLIRSQRDVGAIVILDKRITTKGYGGRFLKSLPPMTRASSPQAIAAFLRERGVAA